MVENYSARHRLPPGITGLAQINGWRGETKDLHRMEKRVEYDLWYIRNWSFWLDIKIILITLLRGFAMVDFLNFFFEAINGLLEWTHHRIKSEFAVLLQGFGFCFQDFIGEQFKLL